MCLTLFPGGTQRGGTTALIPSIDKTATKATKRMPATFILLLCSWLLTQE